MNFPPDAAPTSLPLASSVATLKPRDLERVYFYLQKMVIFSSFIFIILSFIAYDFNNIIFSLMALWGSFTIITLLIICFVHLFGHHTFLINV